MGRVRAIFIWLSVVVESSPHMMASVQYSTRKGLLEAAESVPLCRHRHAMMMMPRKRSVCGTLAVYSQETCESQFDSYHTESILSV